MELGNTFWLWGVLIVQRSVETNLEFRVFEKNRPKPPVMTTNFDFVLEESLLELFCCFRFHTFDFKRKGVITTKTPRIEFNLSNLHFRCPHELNIAFYCTWTLESSRQCIFQLA